MKKRVVSLALTIALVASCLISMGGVSAAQPQGYWPYFSAYSDAIAKGSMDEIMRTGNELLHFYAKFEMNRDIAEMSYNIYLYRYEQAVYEKKGDYAAAQENADKLVACAKYLGADDMATAATARSEKLDPMTEVYTYGSASPVYYGAKHEPASGTYYGRVLHMQGTAVANGAAAKDESIVSFYVEVGGSTAADFAWIIDEYADGRRAIHVALNFPQEASTSAQVAAGNHDANISATLAYLATLRGPVFLRIGAEMNLWETSPSTFISAYRRIADMARSVAPNVALVWSPNYVGSWGSDIAATYPGDAYVDWVGVSLYMNSENMAGQGDYSDSSVYFGRGAFADCVLSMKLVADFAAAHKKPVIVTEGGTGIIDRATGKNYESKAAVQTGKMYAALNMVYPQVKAIIYADTDFGGVDFDYRLSASASVNSAYHTAVAGNKTLIPAVGQSTPSFVKLAGFSGSGESITLSAYADTAYSNAMTVTYTLSGRALTTKTAAPFSCTIDTKSLAVGSHELAVSFDDGAGYKTTKTYTLTKQTGGTVSFAEGWNPVTVAPADVPDAWAAEEVALALENNLVPVEMQKNYTKEINRQDFCALIIRLIEQKSGMGIDAFLASKGVRMQSDVFTDTSDKNILAANALGIVNGRGGGIFDCTSGITRQEAARMLCQAAGVLGIEADGQAPTFADSGSFPTWAAEEIAFVAATSDKSSGKLVMGGVGENRFNSTGSYTTQQAIITMLRLFRA
jgi:Beta-mannanase